MYFQFLGSGTATLPAGWGEEKTLALISSGRIDATAIPLKIAIEDAFVEKSASKVTVPPGSRVQLSGGDVLGRHSVDVESKPDGPLIMIRAIPLLSGIKIRSA